MFLGKFNHSGVYVQWRCIFILFRNVVKVDGRNTNCLDTEICILSPVVRLGLGNNCTK